MNQTAEAFSKPNLPVLGRSVPQACLHGWPGPGERRKWWFILALLATLSMLAIATILIGTYAISIKKVYQVVSTHLTGGDISALDRLYNTVIWEIRIPIILLVVLVGCALAQEISVILLDEPTSSLDFHNQVKVWQVLRRIARQGITILACSHDPNHVAWFCDRVVMLHNRKIVAEGKPREVSQEGLLNTLYQGSCQECLPG